ncbi:MAG: PLP-dependent aminotransferase family protein, partial [Caldilineaceae bacterium]|nr:PLP-dependent aminotransferase family protein [Caldilineaceae bacterium]
DVLVVEDDPYRDLYFSDVSKEADTRPLAADDESGRVIYLSSFSKTLAPGFRVAWLCAAPALLGKFELAKQASDLCTSGLNQQMVNESVRRGLLARQLPKLRAHYQDKRDAMVRELTAATKGAITWQMPRGGFFLWARLSEPLDGDMLLPYAQQRGVIFVSGSAFFVTGQERQFVRLAFSSATPEGIHLGVERLVMAMEDARTAVSVESASPRR